MTVHSLLLLLFLTSGQSRLLLIEGPEMLVHSALLALALQPHAVREVTLPKADRVLAPDFSQIRGVRELPDGRVLISDRLDKGVVVADFTTNALRPVGRTGRGPAEYRLPTALRAMPGDSTLLNDEGNSRVAVIGPDLRIHRSFALMLPGLTVSTGARAVDRQGRYYVQIPGWINQDNPNDSVAVVRFDARTERVDTILRVKGITWLPPGPRYGMGWVVFAPQDGWSLSQDGRIAVVRSGDYHVEWYAPNGEGSVRGSPVPFERLPVTMVERLGYVRHFLENSNIGGRGTDGLSPIPAEMMEDRRVREMAERNTFAETKPPFTDSAPIIAPDATLWVERSTRLNEAALWDVFDGAGRVTARVRLPPRRQLGAIGVRWIYLIATDDDGLQHLERYPRALPNP